MNVIKNKDMKKTAHVVKTVDGNKLGCVNACGIAYLWVKGQMVGECPDTPNAVAWAIANNRDRGVDRVSGLLGDYDMEDTEKRAAWVNNMKDAQQFYNMVTKYTKFYL